MAGFTQFVKESREELRKVTWPSREEVLSSTLVVLGATFVISLFLFFLDNIFESAFDTLIKLGTGS